MGKVILNIGCGKTRIPNSIGVDTVKIPDYVDVQWDLNKTPYPFENNYADEIHCYHVLEHLENPLDVLHEFHRILKKNGKIYMRVPHFSSLGAFTDITHKRPYGYRSFDPFEREHFQHYYVNVSFKILNRRIKYLGLYPNDDFYSKYIHKNRCPLLLRPFVHLMDFLINLSPDLFERLWCFWVGGATELTIVLQKD